MPQQIIEKKAQKEKLPNLGFTGLGWIGRNRMEAIIREGCARVTHIMEPEEENAQMALSNAGSAVISGDLDEMLEVPGLDGVVIATPSAMHAWQAIKSLKKGKAVFCQKPLGRNAREVKEVIDAARTADKLLGVDLSYRYTRAVQEVYQLVKEGSLGDIFAVDLGFHNAWGPDKPWFYDIRQSGGGCIMDLGVHLIDLALWSLDFPAVDSVSSSLYHKGRRIDSFEQHTEDFGSASLVTQTGATINLQCSWNLSAGQDAVIWANFYGTNGGASFRNINGSFYDFIAEEYRGIQRKQLVSPPDDWSGRAGVIWARQLTIDDSFDEKAGDEFIKTAEIMDRIYGR